MRECGCSILFWRLMMRMCENAAVVILKLSATALAKCNRTGSDALSMSWRATGSRECAPDDKLRETVLGPKEKRRDSLRSSSFGGRGRRKAAVSRGRPCMTKPEFISADLGTHVTAHALHVGDRLTTMGSDPQPLPAVPPPNTFLKTAIPSPLPL